jgi:hypothetical protein
MSTTKTFAIFDEDGDELEIALPVKLEVCSRCEGHGTHLTPSIGEHAYTQEEFYDSFDEEGREEYFRRGGMYDVTCHDCKGKNVVPVVDEEACKRDPKLKADYALLRAHWEEEDAYRRERASEARYGC